MGREASFGAAESITSSAALAFSSSDGRARLPPNSTREVMEMTNGAVARRERGVEINAYEVFDEKARALVQRTVAPNTTPEELLMFLSLCANYNLDPFAREAWCIKIPGKNGGEGRLTMIVGKYGWLKIVERQDDYQGTIAGVVHKGDTFKKMAKPVKLPSGQHTYVHHEFDVTGDRGPLLGAYAEVHREGRAPEFFYAKLEQYQPFDTERRFEDQVEVLVGVLPDLADQVEELGPDQHVVAQRTDQLGDVNGLLGPGLRPPGRGAAYGSPGRGDGRALHPPSVPDAARPG